jgi:hypothetical protein
MLFIRLITVRGTLGLSDKLGQEVLGTARRMGGDNRTGIHAAALAAATVTGAVRRRRHQASDPDHRLDRFLVEKQ